ncbi:MAG: hypothetical protein QXN08_02770 [Nitrososphaerales archaeon]
MKAITIAAILTLSTVLSLGSALLLALNVTGIYTPTSTIYILLPYMLAVPPSYFVLRTFLEALTPQPKVESKKEVLEVEKPKSIASETIEVPKPVPQAEGVKIDEKKLEEKEVEQPKKEAPPQPIQDTNTIVEEQLKIEPSTSKQEVPSPTQTSEENASVSNEDKVIILTPILEELKLLQNELNGLKTRLKIPKLEKTVKEKSEE